MHAPERNPNPPIWDGVPSEIVVELFPDGDAVGEDAHTVSFMTGGAVVGETIHVNRPLAQWLFNDGVTLLWTTGGVVDIDELPVK